MFTREEHVKESEPLKGAEDLLSALVEKALIIRFRVLYGSKSGHLYINVAKTAIY